MSVYINPDTGLAEITTNNGSTIENDVRGGMWRVYSRVGEVTGYGPLPKQPSVKSAPLVTYAIPNAGIAGVSWGADVSSDLDFSGSMSLPMAGGGGGMGMEPPALTAGIVSTAGTDTPMPWFLLLALAFGVYLLTKG